MESCGKDGVRSLWRSSLSSDSGNTRAGPSPPHAQYPGACETAAVCKITAARPWGIRLDPDPNAAQLARPRARHASRRFCPSRRKRLCRLCRGRSKPFKGPAALPFKGPAAFIAAFNAPHGCAWLPWHFRCVLLPNSPFRGFWDLLLMCLLFYVAITVPLRIGFAWESVVGEPFWYRAPTAALPPLASSLTCHCAGETLCGCGPRPI